MKNRNGKPWSIWGLAIFLWVLGATLGAHAAPPSFKLPGRKSDSTEPWGAFLGRSAHIAIGRQYGVQYPTHAVFLDTVDLYDIVEEGGLGDPKRLSEFESRLRPDITDADRLVLFEIKPDTEEGLRQGREQAGRYLTVLNSVVEPDKKIAAGTGFEGSIFLEFEKGGVLWQLSWRTPEPGVTLYRWSRRPKREGATWQERAAQKQEALSTQEAEQHGEMAEQALRAAYGLSQRPAEFRGQVYRPVDCR